jgi:cobalamin biosynthesis Mg chelatase CobN
LSYWHARQPYRSRKEHACCPSLDALTDDELVSRRLVELAAAEILMRMSEAAREGLWDQVDKLLEEASHQFAGHEWVASVVSAMKSIAEGRERERMMRHSCGCSSGDSRSKSEGVRTSIFLLLG